MNNPEQSEIEALVRKIAHIVGDSSAAHQAIQELERRRSDGQEAWLTQVGRTWIVNSINHHEAIRRDEKSE